MSTPVKYYGSRLTSQYIYYNRNFRNFRNFGFRLPLDVWACFFDLLSSPLSNTRSQKNKLQSFHRSPPPPVAGLLALTSAITQGQCNEPKPKTPATLRPAADLPRPSADGNQRPGYAPPHTPAR